MSGGSPQARVGDLVKISCPHGPQIGIITTGSELTNVDSRKKARLTDTVICTACGKSGNIVSGSFLTFCDSLKSARVGDATVGTCDIGCKSCPHSRTGEIITGSDLTFTA